MTLREHRMFKKIEKLETQRPSSAVELKNMDLKLKVVL